MNPWGMQQSRSYCPLLPLTLSIFELFMFFILLLGPTLYIQIYYYLN
jgi:hypothetical protein